MASTIGSLLKTSSWPAKRPVSSWKPPWCTAWPTTVHCSSLWRNIWPPGVPTILEIDLQGAAASMQLRRRARPRSGVRVHRAAKLRRARAPPDRPRHRNPPNSRPVAWRPPRWSSAAESESTSPSSNETVDQAAARPLVRHRQGIRAVNYLFTTNCWWRISALFLAGACFQRIASVS